MTNKQEETQGMASHLDTLTDEAGVLGENHRPWVGNW
jgi:hypothetical protein